MKNEVYVVISGRHYENGEEYFSSDGVFPTQKTALEYVEDDLKETLSGYEKARFVITRQAEDVHAVEIDGSLEFFWRISKHVLSSDHKNPAVNIENKVPKVIITIDGGVLTGVHATHDISVDLLDYDNMRVAADDERATYKAMEKEIKSGHTIDGEPLSSFW